MTPSPRTSEQDGRSLEKIRRSVHRNEGQDPGHRHQMNRTFAALSHRWLGHEDLPEGFRDDADVVKAALAVRAGRTAGASAEIREAYSLWCFWCHERVCQKRTKILYRLFVSMWNRQLEW